MMIDRVLSFRIKEDLKRLFNWLIIGLLFVCLFLVAFWQIHAQPFHMVVLLSCSPRRTSPHRITQTAPQPAASSSTTIARTPSRRTSSTCTSTTWWLFSGVSTLSLLLDSARWLELSPPTTGLSKNRLTSPCSLSLEVLYAHSGRLMSNYHILQQ